MVQGIIAGGNAAMFKAQEGAEDNRVAGSGEMDIRKVCHLDVVCGIAAGGTTPFVHGALDRARQLGAKTIFLTCVDGIIMSRPLTSSSALSLAPRSSPAPRAEGRHRHKTGAQSDHDSGHGADR